MSTVVNLGRVNGDPAKINGSDVKTLTANSGINLTQTDNTSSLSADMTVIQGKLSGEPNQIVGFDENGDAIAINANYELYGFELNMDESYPGSMVRYIAQNIGFESAHMDYTTGQFDYGDWENAWFIKNLRPCMLNYDGSVAYDLDKNDYTKKVDGSASDVGNDSFGGNAMVGIPTVWVKVDTRNARKPKFYFANRPLDGSYKAYAHHDSNGNIMPYTYMPIYNGWKDSSNRIRSLSGKTPIVSETIINQITECRANNVSGDDAWDIEKFVDRQLINLLLVLIGKTTDSQTAFGNGNMNGSNNPASGSGTNGILPTGTMNTNGLFYGSTADNLGIKVFGMENYWGNVYHCLIGIIWSNGEPYYKLTSGTEDGSTVQGFDPSVIADNAGTPIGWIHGPSVIGGTPTGISGYYAGYISDMAAGDYGLIPTNISDGSSSTKYCDYGWRYTESNRTRTYITGGRAGHIDGAGMFQYDFVTSSSSNPYYSTAPSCKPNI